MLYVLDISVINSPCLDLVWFSVCNLRGFVFWLNPFTLVVIMDIFRLILLSYFCFLFTNLFLLLLPHTFYVSVLYKLCVFPLLFLKNPLLSSSFHNLIQWREINSPACLRTLCRTFFRAHRWSRRMSSISLSNIIALTREKIEAQRGHLPCPKSIDRTYSHSSALLGSLRVLTLLELAC